MTGKTLAFYQNTDEKIRIHIDAHRHIKGLIDLWLQDDTVDLWEDTRVLQDSTSPFLVAALFFRFLRVKMLEKEVAVVQRKWLQLKRLLSEVLNFDTFSRFETHMIQLFFRNPLFLGFSGEQPVARAAALLGLEMRQEDLDSLHHFVQREKEVWIQKKPSSTLERLVQGELQRETPSFEGLLLPFLALQQKKERPSLLKDVHSARAAAACWESIAKAQRQAQEIIDFLDCIEPVSEWSFGDEHEYYLVIALLSNQEKRGFSWGERHILPFSSLVAALDFVWAQKPKGALVTKSRLRYPDASNCSHFFIQEGIRIDEEVLLGYHTTEKVFLDGAYWSERGRLIKDEAKEHDQKQQEAKDELAKLFLDLDELSSEDG